MLRMYRPGGRETRLLSASRNSRQQQQNQ